MLSAAQVPASTLIGAVLGSAVANRIPLGPGPGSFAKPIRVLGLVLLGCVAGVRLDAGSLETLFRIALPLVAAVLALLIVNIVLAVVLVRRFRVDPVTAVLACAPGGVSEVAIAAQEMGARTTLVLAVHTVRVLMVVLLVLPLLLLLLARL